MFTFYHRLYNIINYNLQYIISIIVSTASAPTTSLSCNFTNLNSCGYHDSSDKESRWVVTASQDDLTGDAFRDDGDGDDDDGGGAVARHLY